MNAGTKDNGSNRGSERRATAGRLALCVAAGVLTFLSYPNFDLFPLAFIALVPLMEATRSSTVRGAFGLGALTGFVTNLGGFYWIIHLLRDFAFLPIPVAVALYAVLAFQQGLVFAVMAALARWLQQRGKVVAWVAWPAALVLAETSVPMIFKWYFGNSQYLNHALAQWAELGGVVLVSTFVAAGNVGCWLVLRRVREGHGSLRAPAVIVAVLVGAHGAGALRLAAVDRIIADSETLRIGLVEADIGIYEKGDPQRGARNLWEHQRLSMEAVEQGAELLVWPETAYEADGYFVTTADVDSEDEARERGRTTGWLPRDATWLPPSAAPVPADPRDDVIVGLSTELVVPPQRGHRVPLLTGVLMFSRFSEAEASEMPPRGGRPRAFQLHNAASLIAADGRVLGTVDKAELMPFSEHVPWGHEVYRWFGVNLYDLIPSAGDFYQGRPAAPLVLPRADGDDVRIGVMICYEDIMPRFGREIGAGHPDVVINVTNDAWFGKTAEPYLHLALATFRSIELRTSLVRSTNTGVSAFVDPAGRIVAQTGLDDAETLVHDTPLVRVGRTPYMWLGNWCGWIALLVLARAALRAVLASRRRNFDE